MTDKPKIKVGEIDAVENDFGIAITKGHRGAAVTTGYIGQACAIGEHAIAVSTGARGVADAEGSSGIAIVTAYESRAFSEGKNGVAIALGEKNYAKGVAGSALFFCERGEDDSIKAVRAVIAGEEGIKPDTWYKLVDGKLILEEEKTI